MIRLATVGSGWIVDCFLEGTCAVPEIVHAAVYSRTREKGEAFAAKHGLPPETVWTDLEALAASGTVNAVYIASPNRFHAQQAGIFLRHGVHVICEKPAAVTPEELEQLHGLARENGVIFMEAIMALHLPRFALLRQAMQKIGSITAAELNFSQLSSKYPAFLRGEKPNVFNPALCTGALMDIGVYDVYLAAALFGEPESVYAAAKFLPGGADGLGYALLRYPWGICSLNWSKIAQSRVGSEILGDQGTITFAPVSRVLDLTLWHTDGSSELLFGQESHAQSMGYEAADFARYILYPGETAEEYTRMLEISMQTAKIMAEIRRQCGIDFFKKP